MSSIKEVRQGKTTDALRNKEIAGMYPDECAFSIIFGDDFESLDLIANTPDEANIWVTGMMCLVNANTKQCKWGEGGIHTTPQALLYSTLPPATAVTGCTLALCDQSADWPFFTGAQAAVCLSWTTQIISRIYSISRCLQCVWQHKQNPNHLNQEGTFFFSLGACVPSVYVCASAQCWFHSLSSNSSQTVHARRC